MLPVSEWSRLLFPKTMKKLYVMSTLVHGTKNEEQRRWAQRYLESVLQVLEQKLPPGTEIVKRVEVGETIVLVLSFLLMHWRVTRKTSGTWDFVVHDFLSQVEPPSTSDELAKAADDDLMAMVFHARHLYVSAGGYANFARDLGRNLGTTALHYGGPGMRGAHRPWNNSTQWVRRGEGSEVDGTLKIPEWFHVDQHMAPGARTPPDMPWPMYPYPLECQRGYQEPFHSSDFGSLYICQNGTAVPPICKPDEPPPEGGPPSGKRGGPCSGECRMVLAIVVCALLVFGVVVGVVLFLHWRGRRRRAGEEESTSVEEERSEEEEVSPRNT